MNAIVADDDASSRELLCAHLRREGLEPLGAGDGAAALGLHASRRVHLVVSDWRMPGMNGLELCRRLRASRARDYTYFILISATFVDRESFRAAMDAGVDDFLLKPLDPVATSLRLRAARRILSYANRLRELEAVIPVCAYCRRLRDDADSYQRMEAYFARHAAVSFSHGICPDCLEQHFPEPQPRRTT